MKQEHYNLDAERGVISACFLDISVLDSCSTRGLHADAFYDPYHRSIFGLMVDMRKSKRSIDIISFIEFSKEKKLFTECGGIQTINSVTQCLDTISSAKQWIDIVLQKATARHVLRQAKLLEAKVSECPNEAQKAAVEACSALNKVCQSSSEMTQQQIGQASIDWFIRRIDPEKQAKSHSVELGITGIHQQIEPFSYDDDVTLAAIMAPPDGGKSTIERQIARANCEKGKTIVRFLLETSAEVSNGQMAASWAGFDLLKGKKPPQRNEFRTVIEYD